jgi:HEPN domain-containing protein
MSYYPLKNKREFLKLIEEVNQTLIENNIPIIARPIGIFAEKLKVSLPITNTYGIFLQEYVPLVEHVHEWYEERYGERLKSDFRLGNSVTIIQGDPWRIKIPLVYGRVNVFFCPPEEVPDKAPEKGAIIINMLDLIEYFPKEKIYSLDLIERNRIISFFSLAYDAFYSIDAVRRNPLITSALSDIDSAVSHIMDKKAQYGLSKWSTLQFSEKLLKSYLIKKGTKPPKSHNVIKLHSLAVKHGMPAIKQKILISIQCQPSVRYEEEYITLENAINSHLASLILCFVVANAMNDHPRKPGSLNPISSI